MVSKAHCSKCGLKHERPVGVRYNRILNQSVPIIAANSSDLIDDHPDLPTPGQPCRSSKSATTGSASSHNQVSAYSSSVDKKLDLLLERMEYLERKNLQLEQKVDQKVKTKTCIVHSSPKRLHH